MSVHVPSQIQYGIVSLRFGLRLRWRIYRNERFSLRLSISEAMGFVYNTGHCNGWSLSPYMHRGYSSRWVERVNIFRRGFEIPTRFLSSSRRIKKTPVIPRVEMKTQLQPKGLKGQRKKLSGHGRSSLGSYFLSDMTKQFRHDFRHDFENSDTIVIFFDTVCILISRSVWEFCPYQSKVKWQQGLELCQNRRTRPTRHCRLGRK